MDLLAPDVIPGDQVQVVLLRLLVEQRPELHQLFRVSLRKIHAFGVTPRSG
jgi:hypothetical protein